MKMSKETTRSGFIEIIKDFGNFNNWKGFICLYFTITEVKQMKKYGVTEDHTIREAYNILDKY